MWYNQLKTTILLASLSGILMLIGSLIGGYNGIIAAFVVSLLVNGFAYFFSAKMVLSMYKAQPLNAHEYGWIDSMVRELIQDYNLPMPKLWLVNTQVANAFATGRNPKNAHVAVTTGILDILTKEELRGVLAHEISHIKNRDILVSSVAATLATSIGFLANMMQNMAMWGSFGRSDQGNQKRSNPIVLLAVAFLMPIAASLIQLAISRSREYLADETGAHVCHDPLALASALEKLQASTTKAHFNNNDTQKASTAHLFIVNPFTGGLLNSLFSTHPPMQERIARLRKINDEMIQENR
ncbi:zinc metalloprotease HtpX [Candidatus Dependentiae bacterium]|nr:zinc metalloprotease HtpX [Candidatus Dependentiae bacterium]